MRNHKSFSGYVYLLTNPSMPGLVKIGKTTSSPSQRMKELHTTGVPKPFELECAFSVEDCTNCERAAHVALAKHRIPGREFFEVSVEVALKKIIPVLGDYSVHFAKSEYGIEDLAARIKRWQEAKRIEENKRREKKRQHALTEQQRHQKEGEIEQKLRTAEYDVHIWHQNEYRRLFPKRSVWFYGIPAGVIVLISLVVLKPNMKEDVLLFWVGLSIWIGGLVLNAWVESRQAKSDTRMALENELVTRLKAVREILCACTNCGQSLRFKRADVLRNDGSLDFRCPKCGAEASPM